MKRMTEGIDRYRLSSEVRLVVRCCRWPLDAATLASIGREASAVDWPRVVAIVRRHRVDALVHRALREAAVTVPASAADRLARSARRVSLHALRLAAETQRLVRSCEDAGISVVVLKGAALARLAYGNLAIKHAADIDLAVAATALPAAREELRRAGYVAAPTIVAKDEPWVHPARDVRVELHAGLVDHDGWLTDMRVDGSLQRVDMGNGATLPTLADDDLFAYLCVHGATHGWSRLKWLADLAAYLAGKSAADIRRFAGRAEQVGAGRPAAQALLLCADLFGLGLDPDLVRGLRTSRINRWLVADALRSLTGRNETVELDAQPWGTIRIHLAQFVFSASWTDRRRLLALKLRPLGGSKTPGAPRTIAGWLRQRWRRSAAIGRRRRRSLPEQQDE